MPGVWLITGASGGHVLPAISFYFLLVKFKIKTKLFIEDKPILRQIVSCFPLGEDIVWVDPVASIKKAPYDFFSKGFLFSKLLNELFDQHGIPDKVILFGAPTCIWSLIAILPKQIRIFVHEQNVVMGDLNKAISLFADKVFYGFGNEHFYSWIKKKSFFTSNLPFNMYESIERGDNAFPDLPIKLLVIGGSQGASSLNEAFTKIVWDLPEYVGVVHLTGNRDWWKVRQEYASAGDRFIALRVISNAYSIIEQADIVISRAGALTLSELALIGKAAIVVPYPHARAHQYYNANYFLRYDAIKVVDEKARAWHNELKSIILYLVGNKEERFFLSNKIKEVIRWPRQEEILTLLE